MKLTILSPISKYSANNGDGRYYSELTKGLNLVNNKQIEINIIQPKKKLNFITTIIYDLVILPIKLINDKSDIYHAITPGETIAPILLKRKTIVTLHDVIYITFPNGTKFLKRLYFYICALFIKKANLIITSSDYSKKEINSTLKIPSNKIHRIYLGIDDKFRTKNINKEHHRIGYLGGINGRKNVPALIKAFSRINKSEFSDYKLILAFSEKKHLKGLIDESGIKNIEFIGNVPESKIADFYNSIDIFVFPSLYEGFGFPPLEAMACGRAVICSNNTSIAEVVGNGAYKVDTTKPEDISDAILHLLRDKKLKNKLQMKAINECKNFTWKNTANNTLKLYQQSKAFI